MFRNSGGVGRRGISDGGTVTYHPWQRNETQPYVVLFRLRSDCILVFYMKKNLRACRFYYVNIFNLARAPKLTIRYLRCPTIPRCEMLDLASPRSNSTILSTSQVLEAPKWSKSYCSFGKVGNPGTNVDFAFFKIVR